jgi:ribosomal protein S18 acetylase RimI-like enzyme
MGGSQESRHLRNDGRLKISMIELIDAIQPGDVGAARILFREYQVALGVDLGFQDFEMELERLPGDYVAPNGLLALARSDGEAAGCVALRALSSETCEMKRLYVRSQYRNTGLGRRLAEHVIARAKSAGYRWMYLDTLPSMSSAQHMYESLGFRDIAPYRFNPIAGSRFLGLEL